MRRDEKDRKREYAENLSKKYFLNRERLIKLLAQKNNEIWQCHSKATSEMYTRNQNQRLFSVK